MKRRKKIPKIALATIFAGNKQKKKKILNLFFISLNVCYKKCCIVNLYAKVWAAEFQQILP